MIKDFNRLTKEQMKNLVQDLNGDLDNLMALPTPMNSSKGKRSADEWAESGFRGGELNADYVDWLRDRQEEITDKAEQMINGYLKNNR